MRPEPWDEETTARAIGMKRAGMSHAQIAQKLGRSMPAVAARMSNLKIKSKVNRRNLSGRLTSSALLDLKDQNK